jgi:diguanylate cyclase (GGDEF)-like protein/PAS domain S-box-containing protein
MMGNQMKEAFATYSRLFSWTMLTGIAGLAGIVVLLLTSLGNEHQEAEKHARMEVENISRLLEEHALADVQKVDLVLRDLHGHIKSSDMRLARGVDSRRARELHVLLASHLETVPEVSVLHLTNAKGEHIHSSLAPLPHIDISDRHYFLRIKNDPTDGLVISSPIISRTTGSWTLALARRLNFEDGSFAGVALAVLNMEHFQNLFRSLNLGDHGSVALYDRELHLAARFPPSEKDMGKIVTGLTFEKYLNQGLKQGVYHARSPVDSIERLFSFRQVGDLPLIVTVGIAEEFYLATWHRHIWQYSVGTLIFCLVVVVFGLRQRRVEEALRQDELRFRYMLETSPIAVRIASLAGRKVLFSNQRYAELIESRPEQTIGVDPQNYYAHLQDYEDVLQSLSRGERVTNKLVEIVLPGGKFKWVLASYLNLKYGNEAAVLGWFYDITERKAAEEQIRNLAFYDTLTQLPNRRLLDDRLAQAMAASKRSGHYGALLFLDLDNFKSLNDTHGHGAGDLLLIEAARRIGCCVRQTDTVSRFGGDEFVVVLSELDKDKDRSVTEASIVAEKIRVSLAEPYVLAIHTTEGEKITVHHHCTSSIGVVLFTNHKASPEDVLKWADIAMYQAKEAGRNLIRFYESRA